jgi:hypothetical protein
MARVACREGVMIQWDDGMSEGGGGRNVAVVMEEKKSILKVPIGEFRGDGKGSFLLKHGEGLGKELIVVGLTNKWVSEVEVNGMDKEVVGEEDDVIMLSVIDKMVGLVGKSVRLNHLRSWSVEES